MWRKQEEPKVNNSSEVREEARAEQVTPAVAPQPPPTPVREVATPPSGHLTSTLVIKGEITGREALFIDGEVQGKIRLEEGSVTIGPNGRVTADVEAQEIVIRGRVKGNVSGRERVRVSPTGHATGDIITQRILIEDGAEIHGRVEIKRIEARPPQSEPVPEKTKPVATAPVLASVAAAAAAATDKSDKPVAAAPLASTAAAKPSVSAKNETANVAAPARESAPVV